MNTNLFLKKSVSDTKELIKNYLDENRGDFFYFRHMSLQMQKRFMELMDHSEMPKVLLHGNPHIENYVITAKGAAMVDFDRSRIGPYAWDIVRFLASISLKKESEEDFFLSDIVLDYFLEGYLRGFYTPNLPFTPAKHITEKADFKVWYDSTEEFLADNIKWAKKMRKDPVPSDDKTMQKILSGYLKSRNELGLLKEFEVSEAGKAMGTFGNKRYLIVLSPKKNVKKESIFLDIKTVYQDPDNEWYYNPFKHHGIRMIKASELYAPNIEFRLGYTTYKGKEYWGREIPYKSAKIKEKLNSTEQLDLAYSVGTQLGRAHGKSLEKGAKAKDVEKHLQKHYLTFTAVAEQMNKEVNQAYQTYCKTLEHTYK